MNYIKKKDLQCGTKFSTPVFFDDKKNMFLAEKKPITQFHLDALKNWNISNLVTYGTILPADYVEDLDQFLEELSDYDDLIDEEQENISPTLKQYIFSEFSFEKNPLYLEYERLISKINILFSKKLNSDENLLPEVEKLVDETINLVKEHPNMVLSFILLGENVLSYLEKSAINTAIITYIIAKKLSITEPEIKNYVAGALLHDIGMLQLPETLINKTTTLSEEEFSEMKFHTVNGFFAVSEKYPKVIAQILLYHHERYDGTGYPSAKKGAEIPMGAAIVAVADAFEAMVSHRPYRNSMLGAEAMNFLISNSGRYYNPNAVNAFIQSMGIYPVGSVVLLNTGQFAHVVDINPTSPLRPKLKIIPEEASSKKLEGIPIPPDQQKMIFILRVVDPREITGEKK
ncbi:MAG: HD-GYP domain-containing protein [Treponemataceae bacterium]